MPEFTSWDAFDWNAFAATLPNVPDEFVLQMLRSAPQGETLFEAWESAWSAASAAVGFPSDKLTTNNKAFRSIILAFYKAEAARRGLDVT
jgi:hypothetical protein